MTYQLNHALPTMGKKHNRYCGPAALAAITGVDTGSAAEMLRKAGGRRAIRGTTHDEILTALGWCGYRVLDEQEFYPRKSMTLRKWLNDNYDGQLVLMSAMDHLWAFFGDKFCDSWNRIPTSIENIHNPKCQVHKVWILEAPA